MADQKECPRCGNELLKPMPVQDAEGLWWLRIRCSNIACPFYRNITKQGVRDLRKIPQG